MSPELRKKLLALKAKAERLIREAEALSLSRCPVMKYCSLPRSNWRSCGKCWPMLNGN